MITIIATTDEEAQAVKDALRDGILHEVLGESFTITVRDAPAAGYYVYTFSDDEPPAGSKP